jgi:hypothetical protein
MADPEMLARLTARRVELDELEEQLAKQLAEVRVERDELAVAERVWARISEQLAAGHAQPLAAAPRPGRVAGAAVLLVAHRAAGVSEAVLPPDYQRILAIVRQAGGPVAVRQVGAVLGLPVEVRGKLEPLRGKLSKLADRGWLRKLADGRFTASL